MKIAITGATGQLGHYVIQALLTKTDAQNIVALVRDLNKDQHLKAQGVELRHFDYDQTETLAPALEGIDKLLLISANEIGRRTPQHQVVIQAAQQSKVPYIAYTSLLNADTSALGLSQEHRETEALIKESGLAYTFLRNNWYTENYLAGLSHAIESGTLYGAANDGKISSASRIDYAEAAATVLVSDTHENRIYELAGSTAFTLQDLADAISEVSGQAVQYKNLTSEQYHQGLVQAGLPTGLVDVIVDADVKTQTGAMFSDSKDLEKLIRRKTTSIQEEIKNTLNTSSTV